MQNDNAEKITNDNKIRTTVTPATVRQTTDKPPSPPPPQPPNRQDKTRHEIDKNKDQRHIAIEPK